MEISFLICLTQYSKTVIMGTNVVPILTMVLGSKEDAEYWKSIIIDTYTYGTQVAFMDLFTYKSDRFRKSGKFDIYIFLKGQNKYIYIPQKSYHRKLTIKNYVLIKRRRYVKYNTEKYNELKLRNKFFDRLRNRGFRKYLLTK